MADDKFRAHVPNLIAAAGGTVLAALAGSYIGIGGTLLGLIGGSFVSGTASWWIDRGLRKSAERAKAKANFRKRHGREPNAEETQAIDAVVEMQVNVKHSRGIPWRMISIISATVLGLSLVAVIFIETIAQRTPAQVLHGHGVTLSGTDTAPSKAPPSYTPPPYTPSPPPTITPRITPTPSPSTTTPSPTPTVTVTVSPTFSPSVSPSVTPTDPTAPVSTAPPLIP